MQSECPGTMCILFSARLRGYVWGANMLTELLASLLPLLASFSFTATCVDGLRLDHPSLAPRARICVPWIPGPWPPPLPEKYCKSSAQTLHLRGPCGLEPS
jgi:hypothetical protein